MLSVIIPTHKRAFQVTRLLNSLLEQDFPKNKLQVLLISNLADPLLRAKIPDWRQKFFYFQYKEVGVKGVNKARNMGIRFARGDILYFLDDDCLLPHPQHLKNLVEAHQNQALAVGIGGPYRSLEPPSTLTNQELFYQQKSEQWLKESLKQGYPSEKENLSLPEKETKKGSPIGPGHPAEQKNPGKKSEKLKGLLNHPAEQGKPTSQLLGGNASYKKEVFEQGYFFDPQITFGGSELSFNDSLKDKTLLFNPKLWVYHQVDLSPFSLIKKAFKQGQGSSKRDSQKAQALSVKQEWAFLSGTKNSFYSSLYQLLFKLGYFWEISSLKKSKSFFSVFRFIYVILKSRWYFIKNYFIWKFFIGPLQWGWGYLYRYLLGPLWYGLGWIYGHLLRGLVGPLWYGLGWIYGRLLRVLIGPLWYGLGWIYGHLLRGLIGPLWYGLGWVYGRVLRVLIGPLWYGLGWIYGRVLRVLIGPLWYVLGWFYGHLLRGLIGLLWYGLGWVYGRLLNWFIGPLWYGLGWLFGALLRYILGPLWYAIGWTYGNILLFLFHHSPPMKLYYFSRYQYQTRIKPLFLNNKAFKNKNLKKT